MLDKVHDHLVKHYANVTSAPRQPAGRHLPRHQTAARVEPGQREGLLRTARTMQAAAPRTIVGLHASDSVRDRFSAFTSVATAMQCMLAR